MFFSSQPPRVCDVYWTEFKHCKSLRNRLHHYYTYGTSPVCLQWKDDYEACREWERNRSPHAKVSVCCKASHDRCSTTEVFQYYCFFLFFLPPPQESLQKSERQRVAEQKNFPPFWEMRQKPPADWHLPLNEEK